MRSCLDGANPQATLAPIATCCSLSDAVLTRLRIQTTRGIAQAEAAVSVINPGALSIRLEQEW